MKGRKNIKMNEVEAAIRSALKRGGKRTRSQLVLQYGYADGAIGNTLNKLWRNGELGREETGGPGGGGTVEYRYWLWAAQRKAVS